MKDKWQEDFDEAYKKYKAEGHSDQQAWSWACNRANDKYLERNPINGSDDRSMYGPS